MIFIEDYKMLCNEFIGNFIMLINEKYLAKGNIHNSKKVFKKRSKIDILNIYQLNFICNIYTVFIIINIHTYTVGLCNIYM